MSPTKPKLTADGGIPDIPENAEFLRLVAEAKPLNPRQLLEMAARLRDIPGQKVIADHLAAAGLSAVAAHPPVIAAVQKIKDVEVGWSLFGDIWHAVVHIFGGTPASGGGTSGDSSRDDYGSTAGSSGCVIKCVTPLFGGGVMVEKCKNDKNWRVIGLCFGSSF